MTDTDAGVSESLGYRLGQAARAHRSFPLGEILVAAISALRVVAQRAYARYRQQRKAAGIRDVLRELDDRTLRDIGVDRSEIASVAAELTGQAERSRVHTWQAAQELPAAWTVPVAAPVLRLVEPIERAKAADRTGTTEARRRGDAVPASEIRRQVLLALELETIDAGAGWARSR